MAPTPRSLGAGKDVVFTFSFLTWDGAMQRGMAFPEDRLACRLLEDPRVGRVIVANSYRSAARRAARRLVGSERPFPDGNGATLVSPVRVRRDDPVHMRALERAYARYDRSLRRAAERAGLHQPAVITASPLVAGYAGLEWAGRVTYYATDDWSSHPSYASLSAAVLEAYARVRARDHRVCAVSEPLLERIAPTGPSLVVDNGVDPREWRRAGAPPSWFAALPSPRLVYAGTLDARLDVDRVLDVARRFERGSVVLVGPDAANGSLQPLRAAPNVHLRPALPRAQLAAVLLAADAALIPHRRSALSESMSPLKLYEYLAAGRPVASVDLPPIRAVRSSRIALAGEGDDFADVVERALRTGPAPEPERLAFLDANSWERRHDRLIDFALAV